MRKKMKLETLNISSYVTTFNTSAMQVARGGSGGDLRDSRIKLLCAGGGE